MSREERLFAVQLITENLERNFESWDKLMGIMSSLNKQFICNKQDSIKEASTKLPELKDEECYADLLRVKTDMKKKKPESGNRREKKSSTSVSYPERSVNIETPASSKSKKKKKRKSLRSPFTPSTPVSESRISERQELTESLSEEKDEEITTVDSRDDAAGQCNATPSVKKKNKKRNKLFRDSVATSKSCLRSTEEEIPEGSLTELDNGDDLKEGYSKEGYSKEGDSMTMEEAIECLVLKTDEAFLNNPLKHPQNTLEMVCLITNIIDVMTDIRVNMIVDFPTAVTQSVESVSDSRQELMLRLREYEMSLKAEEEQTNSRSNESFYYLSDF